MSKSGAHCHKRIRDVAKSLAAATYEELMSDNHIYANWKKSHPAIRDNPKRLQQAFVNAKWGAFVPGARTTLALLLRDPTLTEVLKEEIMEVLIMDSALIKGRVNPAKVAGELAVKT